MQCIIAAAMTVSGARPAVAVPAAPATQAYYIGSTSVEGEVPPVSELAIVVGPMEQVGGRAMQWWELSARLSDDTLYGIRILSERAPMTSGEGIGLIHRYIYRDPAGVVLEYRDATTGKALTGPLQFAESFLPCPAPDAVFTSGFASAGSFLGHVLVLTRPVRPLPRVTFRSPRLLGLRTDLVCGPHTATVDTMEGDQLKQRPWTRGEYDAMLEAGANFFDASSEQTRWLQNEAVFWRGQPVFPDSFYRANWIPGQMFIDEPSVRLGGSGGIPGNATGPEQVAQAMRLRVKSHYAPARRRLAVHSAWGTGTLDLTAPPAISWDTDYWSAWYQMSARAPAVVHEGRYVERGYGWEPEELFGREGLAGLAFSDQVHCLNAFLRGAARAFQGDWGVSVYPEGDPALRLPALTRAYDMGARYIWFWNYPPLTYDIELELLRGLSRHAAQHPRGSLREANRQARTAIALPPGYAFSWQGSWGAQRDGRTRGGATYADVSAALMWEGILCSRRHLPFDFVVDDPRLDAAGYERIIRVGENAGLTVRPAWNTGRPPHALSMAVEPGDLPGIAGRARLAPEHRIPRPAALRVDGRLDDWPAEAFLELTAGRNGFPDGVSLQTTIRNDLSRPEWRMNFTRYMGVEFTQVTDELERKYVIEDLHGLGVVVTAVDPGSPATRADIRVGDVITGVLDWPIKYQFQMHQRLERVPDGVLVPVRLRRSGRYDFGGPGDLEARVALAADDERLYVAADVTDDAHHQPRHDADLWRSDSIQVALDPTLERRTAGYGEEDIEFALALTDDGPLCWRYAGRRGQFLGPIQTAIVRAAREGDHTRYEAAIPLREFPSLAPGLWPRVGLDVVVNDSDGQLRRHGRLELRPKAMTQGKKTAEFMIAEFDPASAPGRLSSTLLWRRRATPTGGFFRLVVAGRAPQAMMARIQARLQSLDSPEAPAATAELPLAVGPEPTEHNLVVRTDSPPGRYDLAIRIEDASRAAVAADHLPVFIYPP